MRALSEQDKVAAFKAVTCAFEHRFADQINHAMDDADLRAALQDILGIAGGRYGPVKMALAWQGAGLKIWASWSIQNHRAMNPVFAGQTTVNTARRIYRILDPQDRQLELKL